MDSPYYRHISRVTFGDTDCSGWLHFPKIFRHIEEAEHAFLREKGIMIIDRQLGGWPRVHVSCDYKQPLLFGDEIEVQLSIERLGASSVHWIFEVWKGSGLCALGKMTTVRVDGQGRPALIDEVTRNALSL
jgi:acyl-CoA thioester hydrolase